LIRDGTHKLKHEWLPVENPQPGQPIGFQTLPFDEMPHVINPKQGFIVNANNDPVGTITDNDPLNQYRKGGGVYYLNSSYPLVVRAKRIVQLLQEKLSKREKLSLDDMMRFQADNRLPEAETFMPYILKAFDNARLQNAHPALAALAANPGVAEAVSRFRQWDFSSPTGISHNKQGSNGLENQPDLSVKEIQSSICATIYSVWRSRILNNTIDATLRRLELGAIPTGIAALRHLLDSFETNHGKGASGVNFFHTNEATSPEIARDTIILKSLQDALNDLASDSFAPAFRKSANQNDYRWGLLHRVRFNHRLGKRFNLPEAAGFTHVSPELPGIAVPGGFESLEVIGHGPRVTSVNSFMSGSGQACRFVSEMKPRGPNAFMIIPGGESGDVRSQFYANMMKSWLTHQYHPMRLTRKQASGNVLSIQIFQPTRGRIPKK
jgi:penicillin amidase